MQSPCVGIFWMLRNGRVVIDSTPLDKAERHNRYLIHSPSHFDVWERLRREGVVPQELEYDDVPRGRVAFDWISERFTLLADPQILRHSAAMRQIMFQLSLPPATQTGTDPHYRTDTIWREDDGDEG